MSRVSRWFHDLRTWLCNLFRRSPRRTEEVEAPPEQPSEGRCDIPQAIPTPTKKKQRPRPVTKYRDYGEYLRDELCRIDALLKAELHRHSSSAQMRAKRLEKEHPGLPDACQVLTRTAFTWHDPVVVPDCQKEMKRWRRKARQLERLITARLAHTDKEVRRAFPLWELSVRYRLVPNLAAALCSVERHPTKPLPRDTVLLDVLLLALLAQRVPRYRAALLQLTNDDGTGGGLTTELALHVVQPRAGLVGLRWEVFEPASPLFSGMLLEAQDQQSVLSQRPVRIDGRCADFLLERHTLDPLLGTATTLHLEVADWQQVHLDAATIGELRRLSEWWFAPKPPVQTIFFLHGPDGSPFLKTISAFLTTSKQNDKGQHEPAAKMLLVVDIPSALRQHADWDAFARRVYREAVMRKIPVLWHDVDALTAGDATGTRLTALMTHVNTYPYTTFLAGNTAWEPAKLFTAPTQYFVRIELFGPTVETRRRIWKHYLSPVNKPLAIAATAKEQTALELLATFQFTEGQIVDALVTARGEALAAQPAKPTPTIEHLYEGCRRQSGRRLVSFAQRIQPRPDTNPLDRVILPKAATQQLLELKTRMQNLTRVHHDLGFEQRLSLGRGLVALFTGPSGTGKTMAALALAAANQKDLYKVDMAAIVSKFVGETEKNLSRVFADAQDANAVLFFDEADSLFGKRGDVEQAQDRWANLEVNYLLQRIEEYSGTVILATNYRQNIDSAFMRRVQALLDFKAPDAEARHRIMTEMFPDLIEKPHADDLHALATQFDVTGGNIKNIVLDAAFRAVAETPDPQVVRVTLRHMVFGFVREYQKLNKSVSIGSFGKRFYEIAKELAID